MYRLVIFDWDGTLMDSAQKIANCLIRSAKDVGIEAPTVEQAKNIIGLGLHEAMQQLFPDHDQTIRTQVVEAYKHNFVVADDTEQGLFDGSIELLKMIEASGAMLAVATGKSRRGLDRILSELNLEGQFVVTRCADETRSKPHPQMLNEILGFTAIEPSSTLMIGDTSYDMEMASNANVVPLGVAYGVHTESVLKNAGAIGVMQSVTELSEWLQDGRLQNAY